MGSRYLFGKGGVALVMALLVFIFTSLCLGAATDTIRDVDQQQSGYLDNHNMDPGIIEGVTFSKVFREVTQHQAKFF